MKSRFSAHALNNGPNCYNTTLIALGYMNDVVHISPDEAELYLNRFCQVIPKNPLFAENGLVISYRSRMNSQLEHLAALIGNGDVFEKYNYLGTWGQNSKHPDWDYLGAYLFQPLKDSKYFIESAKFSYQVLKCAPATQVYHFFSNYHKKDWAQKLLHIRQGLAHDLASIQPSSLASYFRGAALQDMKVLLQVLKLPIDDKFEKEYRRVLALSHHNHIYYLLDDQDKYCPACTSLDSSELRSVMKEVSNLLSSKRLHRGKLFSTHRRY